MLRREFVYSQEHSVSQSNSALAVMEITNYDELVDSITAMITQCHSEQRFRLTDFSDNIELEIKNAIQQVLSTPLGMYAVNNILYKTSLILNYIELTFNVSYNCTAEDIREIITLNGKMDLKIALTEQLSMFSDKILFFSESYETVLEDIDENLLEIYYMNPLFAIGYKGYSYTMYPNNNLPYIVELEIDYIEPEVLLLTKVKNADDKIVEILETAKEYDTSLEALKFFHDYLAGNVVYDAQTQELLTHSNGFFERTPPFSIYGALIEQSAVSEGYALAMKELCDRYGITCTLISGHYNGVYHMWNRVYLDGLWYNIDVSADALGDGNIGYRYFCVTDEQMLNGYTWDSTARGVCSSTLIFDTLETMGVDESMLNASRYME